MTEVDVSGRTALAIARNIVNQLFDAADVPVGKRQALNDQCDQFVAGLLDDWRPDTPSLVELVQDLAHELLQVEANCPCGARPETIKTHPHVSGCPVAAGLAKWEAWAVPQPGAEGSHD